MGTIRLLTYNVKMLPDLARVLDATPPLADSTRAARIANTIRRQANRWDVVCLQEVFDEDRRGQLLRRLRAKASKRPIYGHFIARSADKDFLEEDSGLMLASRHPIVHRRFYEYAAAAGADAHADKGVSAAAINTVSKLDGTMLIVFHTHLQADAEHRGERLQQLRELKRFMKKRLGLLRKPETCAVIVCGDMNVTAEHVDRSDGTVIMPTEEYLEMCRTLGDARDLYREAHAGAPLPHGATWNPQENTRMIRDRMERKERLDYIFAIDSLAHPIKEQPAMRFRTLRTRSIAVEKFPDADAGFLSDHYGVSAELEVAPLVARRRRRASPARA